MPLDPALLDRARRNAASRLLEARDADGAWSGELSDSALSTATAIVALHQIDRGFGSNRHADRIAQGLRWLETHQNEDGGWGDTVRSFSNISTTVLVWSALGLTGQAEQAAASAGHWIRRQAGGTSPESLVPAILARYGKDRTFSVPILMMAALCGRLGDPAARSTWKWVKPLPFELAALPQHWFHRMNLQVVSYALPALIAIGQLRHVRRPSANPLLRAARAATRSSTLRLLDRIQPEGGGFLEATPLTSFVTMALAGSGLHDHPVARRGVEFLVKSQRTDGAWPIDTNLATWVTTLSVNALSAGGKLQEHLDEGARRRLHQRLIGQQYTQEHPYTLAAPGGWAWTDLPGGVPDADDTSSALLALKHLGIADPPTHEAAIRGIDWLNDLQNRDGGMPTFCRGWGKLPFDRSCPDITAHAIRARRAWPHLADSAALNARAFDYLKAQILPEGSWHPLWFGNQHRSDETNPVYGTSRVLIALAECELPDESRELIDRGTAALRALQNDDGGWGGGKGTSSTIEETALALEALFACGVPLNAATADRGLTRLLDLTHEGTCFEPAPIGFYFAKLWYFEKLYPLIFTVAALERARAVRPGAA